jgi:hypothetical protein
MDAMAISANLLAQTVIIVIAGSDPSAAPQRAKAEATKQSISRYAVTWIASLRSQ